ncbi:hypothetical protein C5E08_11395 [Rathayibacter iranicus]|uniref:Uncharacterized protein n=2 Tax=Rathayibacter iranicus TaxID=59737 RepID=A0AAD1AFD2_9MICO|nr:hypothetical protein C7V51_11540 [Rathayibacter iranicus]PPI44811.1 hypothetical protein C5E09_10465 [Rathayibacter iranicus]PPI59119.1 hypothetical protein C5E08_11395 [Rathayibacter iranicus]PPI70336.1 hypothetical protein C5E01_10435 [Rathayibacter iranicus]PWJ62924.1 hypothetical protein B0H03_10953 [Rathayibacter iranicus NCPPB 2253 = VKM Ac-1602]
MELDAVLAVFGAFREACSWVPLESISVFGRCRRRRASLRVGALVMVMMTGLMFACAEKGARPVNTMSPREGRDKVVELVVDTTKQLDVEGWWARDGESAPDVCSLAGGAQGASYRYSQEAPEGTDFLGDARRVAAYWESLGMSVRVADSTRRPAVFGEGGPVLRASFDTGAAAGTYRVGAVARCAPGYAAGLLREDNAQREAGVVLPGDEGVREQADPRPTPTQEPPAEPSE